MNTSCDSCGQQYGTDRTLFETLRDYNVALDKIARLEAECAALKAERDAHWAEHRLLQIALSEIGGAKSVTATPTQFYKHLQREANKALSENAMREGVLWDVPKSGAMQAGEKL